jgi:hypothetical protein
VDVVGVEVVGDDKTRKERGWGRLKERGERELFFEVEDAWRRDEI